MIIYLSFIAYYEEISVLQFVPKSPALAAFLHSCIRFHQRDARLRSKKPNLED